MDEARHYTVARPRIGSSAGAARGGPARRRRATRSGLARRRQGSLCRGASARRASAPRTRLVRALGLLRLRALRRRVAGLARSCRAPARAPGSSSRRASRRSSRPPARTRPTRERSSCRPTICRRATSSSITVTFLEHHAARARRRADHPTDRRRACATSTGPESGPAARCCTRWTGARRTGSRTSSVSSRRRAFAAPRPRPTTRMSAG